MLNNHIQLNRELFLPTSSLTSDDGDNEWLVSQLTRRSKRIQKALPQTPANICKKNRIGHGLNVIHVIICFMFKLFALEH